VAVDPTGKFAYLANLLSDVSAYSIGSNGALTPVPGSPFAAGAFPFSVAITPWCLSPRLSQSLKSAERALI
jgi:hypothetical protein